MARCNVGGNVIPSSSLVGDLFSHRHAILLETVRRATNRDSRWNAKNSVRFLRRASLALSHPLVSHDAAIPLHQLLAQNVMRLRGCGYRK